MPKRETQNQNSKSSHRIVSHWSCCLADHWQRAFCCFCLANVTCGTGNISTWTTVKYGYFQLSYYILFFFILCLVLVSPARCPCASILKAPGNSCQCRHPLTFSALESHAASRVRIRVQDATCMPDRRMTQLRITAHAKAAIGRVRGEPLHPRRDL
jgi:hypothetical protein